MTFLGDPEDSLEMLQEGVRLSKELGDTKHLARFNSSIGTYYSLRGNPQLGIKYSEDAFENARKNQDIELLAPLGCSLAFSYSSTGEYYKVVDMAPSVIDLIEKTGRKSDFFSVTYNPYSYLCCWCGLGMGYLGNFEDGKVYLEKGLRNASDINHLATLAFAEGLYGVFFYVKGDFKHGIEQFQKSITYFEEGNVAFLAAISLTPLGSAYSMLGDHETGRRHAEKGLEMYRDSGVEWLLSWLYFLLGSIHLEMGDLNKARSLMEEALRLSQKNNEKFSEASSWIELGRILGKTEPPQIDQAVANILKGIEICRELKIKAYYSSGYLYLGEIYLNAGEKEKAEDNLKKAEGMFQDMGMDYYLGRTYAVYADLSRKEGDQSKAKENLNKAIEILRECGADGWVEKYEKELATLS